MNTPPAPPLCRRQAPQWRLGPDDPNAKQSFFDDASEIWSIPPEIPSEYSREYEEPAPLQVRESSFLAGFKGCTNDPSPSQLTTSSSAESAHSLWSRDSCRHSPAPPMALLVKGAMGAPASAENMTQTSPFWSPRSTDVLERDCEGRGHWLASEYRGAEQRAGPQPGDSPDWQMVDRGPPSAQRNRPTVGDIVTILNTRKTRENFPGGIGKQFIISTDAKDIQPYQVRSHDVWFYRTDVQPFDPGLACTAATLQRLPPMPAQLAGSVSHLADVGIFGAVELRQLASESHQQPPQLPPVCGSRGVTLSL